MGDVQSQVLQAWLPVGSQAIDGVAHLSQALGLCARAAEPLIRVHTNWASGVCWGCLSSVHGPGAEGVGAQEATAAVENSLNSF